MRINNTNNTTLTPDEIEHKKHKINKFMLQNISDEIKGACAYDKYAICAKEIGNQSLAMALHEKSQTELGHAKFLFDEIYKMNPRIEDEFLFPLMSHLEDWYEEVEESVKSFR